MSHPKMGTFFLFWLVLLLSGCSDQVGEAIENHARVAKLRLDALATELESGQIRNASLLTQYGALLKQQKPDYAPLIDELAKDATRSGLMFKGLEKRLDQATSDPQAFVSKEEQLAELENIIEAANPDLFSDALSDPINVLADMSDGKLARVNAVSQASSLQANGAQDFGAGSQLVGNPSYGQWNQNSSGASFWQWYGMYSLLSNLTRPVMYGAWSQGRDYSYYNDYGRSRYTSPSQFKAQDQQVSRATKQFGNNNSKFNSPYAKSRTGSSQVSSVSQKAKATSRFAGRSSYSANRAKSRTSSTNSSFRTNRNTSSRSPSRGK